MLSNTVLEALARAIGLEKEIKGTHQKGENQITSVADNTTLYIQKTKDSIMRMFGFVKAFGRDSVILKTHKNIIAF